MKINKLLLLLIYCIPTLGFCQNNSGEEKPSAAVAVIQTISDTFLPGVFTGVKSILESVDASKKTKKKLEEASSKISDLEKLSRDLRTTSVNKLKELNKYYEDEAKDFKTINEYYLSTSIFSTKVSSLTTFADIATNSKIGFSSNDAKIAMINQFKDAARQVVNNFNIKEENFVSENKLLNADILNEKRIVDDVIGRIKGSALTSTSTTTMSDAEIKNFFDLVADIKNNGSRKFSDLENSVLKIQTYLGSYLKDFQNKTEKINKNIENTIKAFERKDKENE